MTEVLNTITQAIKLLEKKNYDAAEFLLCQEVININRKAIGLHIADNSCSLFFFYSSFNPKSSFQALIFFPLQSH